MTDSNRTAPFDYVAEANVTCSNNFHGELLSVEAVRSALIRCVEALRVLDVVKKTLFYGRSLSETFASLAPSDATLNANGLPNALYNLSRDGAENIIHGIIGAATENGELLEALYYALFENRALDMVNIEEETGDAFWYYAVLAKTAGFTFDGAQRRNIAKLRHRFPNRFNEYDALNRDLFGERDILEKKDLGPLPAGILADESAGLGCAATDLSRNASDIDADEQRS